MIAISGFKDTPDALREVHAIGDKVPGMLELRENVCKVLGGVLLHQGTPHLVFFRVCRHAGKPPRLLYLRRLMVGMNLLIRALETVARFRPVAFEQSFNLLRSKPQANARFLHVLLQS
ncbi:hypothetical protein D3C76_920080 [compost metagenome]